MEQQIMWIWGAGGLLLGALLMAVLLPSLRAGARRQGYAEREPEVQRTKAELEALQREVAQAQRLNQRLEDELAALRTRADRLSDDCAKLEGRLERVPQLESQLAQREHDLAAERRARNEQEVRGAGLDSRLQEQQRAHEEKLALLATAESRLRDSFQTLAQQILDERAQRFDEQSRKQIGGLVDPLREQLKSFQESVNAAQMQDRNERVTLAGEIKSLRDLNQRISEEAVNLTRALRGDTQKQGAWGEMVLERVLEASGLQAGREYDTQLHFAGGDGSRARPDVIIHLPDEKDLVIDAKVSLIAYERYCNADDEAERAAALAEHLASLRRHIGELSRRAYTDLPGLRTLDFVLMFVPVEAAFIDAVRADAALYQFALDANVSLVSPSTLLATLRTVAHLWRIEQRNINAAEIARRAANLHDHFVSLVGEIEQVGQLLDRAGQAQKAALRRITEGGNGSVILQVRSLAELGAPARKRLPAAPLQMALGETGEDGVGAYDSAAEPTASGTADPAGQ
ncbi:MAG: DNA recombination protein RmuC [Lysobacteraceae bacterium]